MRVFVAGGTGAIGKFLVPQLLAGGHEVIALARSPEKARALEAMGANPAVADALNKQELTAAITAAKPEVIIHQLTALTRAADFKNLDEVFTLTNRFRTEVTDTLLSAARTVGTRRFIAQSFCGWPFGHQGGPVKTEEDPLDPNPPANFRKTLAAIRSLEESVKSSKDVEALALRYGLFYGPGTAIAKDGPVVDLIRKHKLPIVGNGAGVWSFIHIEDAARATVAAMSRGSPGIYNVVDDEPAPVSTWLPYLAEVLGAKPPQKLPALIARVAIGEGGVMMMTEVRGGSNAKAKRELGWQPMVPSWRTGFVQVLGERQESKV